MNGLMRAAPAGLLTFYGTHDIYQLEGNWYAWRPAPGDPLSGVLSHARTPEELAVKLGG